MHCSLISTFDSFYEIFADFADLQKFEFKFGAL